MANGLNRYGSGIVGIPTVEVPKSHFVQAFASLAKPPSKGAAAGRHVKRVAGVTRVLGR